MSVTFADPEVDEGTDLDRFVQVLPSGLDDRTLSYGARARPRVSLDPTVAGNQYDLVLACDPSSKRNHPLYDSIIDLADRSNFRIYSPHSDLSEDAIRFTSEHAIPGSKGVILHLDEIASNNVNTMYTAITTNDKPYLAIVSREMLPEVTGLRDFMRADPTFVGDLVYSNNEDAIEQLAERIDELLSRAKGAA